MPIEDGATKANSGQSSAGEGAGSDKLSQIALSIDAIKGVVGDLVTKVSDIERSVQERQDLAEIMRNVGPSNDNYEDMSQFERQPAAPATKQPDEVAKIASNLENTLKKSLDTINRRIDDVIARVEVKQLEMAEPDFNTKIRPLAFQISKEPGMAGLSVEQITNIAKGRLALKQNQEYSKELSDMKAKLSELEERAMGDKPGLFVGISEPPKKMSADEAFEDAFKKSGADRLLR